MHILIYIVKFAKETTSIQLLDDEDGVTQSSNETIYRVKRSPTVQVNGCCYWKRCCLICFFLNKVKKKAKKNVVLRTEDCRLEYILSMYMIKTANDACC
jgi:hypothetical protein